MKTLIETEPNDKGPKEIWIFVAPFTLFCFWAKTGMFCSIFEEWCKQRRQIAPYKEVNINQNEAIVMMTRCLLYKRQKN